MRQVLPLLLTITGRLLAQLAAGDSARAQLAEEFGKAQTASANGRWCEASNAFELARQKALGLDDKDAQSVAWLGLAQNLERGGSSCTLQTNLMGAVTSERAFQEATEIGNPGRKAAASNAYAAFLHTKTGAAKDGQARKLLENVQREFENNPAKSGIARRDMAVYQYNLAILYESEQYPNYQDALEEYKKSLWNSPAFEPAAGLAFRLLSDEPAGIDIPEQGAEVATILIAGGQGDAARKLLVQLLTRAMNDDHSRVPRDPDAQLLVGALLRSYLAQPPGKKDVELDAEALTSASMARRARRELVRSIRQFLLAASGTVSLFHSPSEAARSFSEWVEGPSSVAGMATLLKRRGLEEESENNARQALAMYAAAWYLNPADIEAGRRCANLLKVHKDLDDGSLSGRLLELYVPKDTKFGLLATSFQSDPARLELRRTAEDWENIRQIYRLLAKTQVKSIDDTIGLRIEAARRAQKPMPEGTLDVRDGDLAVRGAIPKGTDPDANAVYVEVRSKKHQQAIREVAIASVDDDNREYAADLMLGLAAGDTVLAYTITYGKKSETPIDQREVQPRRPFLRHVRTFASTGVDAIGGRPMANLAYSAGVHVEDSFRFWNQRDPYFPSKGGYLISPFAEFRYAPISVVHANSYLKQTSNAATLEGGVYVPRYAHLFSHYRNGYPYSFYIAPIGKAGFHLVPNEEQTLYKYAAGGSRFGAYRFSRYGEKVPETIAFVDVSYGKWENLRRVENPVAQTHVEIKGQFPILGSASYVGVTRTLGPGPNEFRLSLGIRFGVGALAVQ